MSMVMSLNVSDFNLPKYNAQVLLNVNLFFAGWASGDEEAHVSLNFYH